MINFLDPSPYDIVGLTGVGIYLGSYAGMQLGFFRGQSYLFATLVIAAAACVLVGLQRDFNLSAAVIQISMIAISLVGIMRLYFLHLTVRFSAEERALLDRAMPSIPKHIARQFLDSGAWAEGRPGVVLTTQGEPVRELIYLSKGRAAVYLDDQIIAHCEAPCFIGELSCLDVHPASATVTLTEQSRFFCIGAKRLRQLVGRRPDFEHALRSAFQADTRNKLLVSNSMSRDLHRKLSALAVVPSDTEPSADATPGSDRAA